MVESELVAAYQAGQLSQTEIAEKLFPMIKKIAGIVAFKYQYDPEDLAQELWLLFIEKIARTYNPEQSLFNFVYEHARRLCLDLKSEGRWELNFTNYSAAAPTDAMEGEANHEQLCEQLSAKHVGVGFLDEDGISASKSGQLLLMQSLADIDLLQKLPGIAYELRKKDGDVHTMAESLAKEGIGIGADDVVLLETIHALDAKREGDKVASDGDCIAEKNDRLGVDHIELRDLRTKMGYTKNEYALLLGIQKASLDAYEYGRTKKVPDDVMERARGLLANHTDILLHVRQKFEGKSMSKILADWAQQMKISLDESERLASILGTSTTTLRRWRNDECRAGLKKLAEMDYQVVNRAS